jgi:shikimate kinase
MAPKVILIGPPGAGKSVIGKNLAQKLNSDFADTDNLIESETGKECFANLYRRRRGSVP